MTGELFDLVIVGGGPAGLSAAIYLSRMGVRSLLLERGLLGGRAVEAPMVENFPGFPEGIRGDELIARMVQQAKRFGAEMRHPEEALDLLLEDRMKITVTRNDNFRSLGVIIATGTQRRKLSVGGETEFLGRGVSYCPVCDGPFFKGKVTAVVGFSDEALEDALNLSNHSRKVTIITEQEKLEASEELINECEEMENIEILRAKVKSILGDTYVDSVMISDLDSNVDAKIPVDGVFISLGSVPAASLVKKVGVTVDDRGCIKVDRRQATNVEGVYAAGDCTCGGMQIATAVGEGAVAAIQAFRYVKNLKK